MASIEEIRSERTRKLELLRGKGVDPYPAESGRTHTCGGFLKTFTELNESKSDVIIAGRVMSLRNMGALIFVDLFDGDGRVQVVFNKETEGLDESALQLFADTVDIGDFVECAGRAFYTKRGKESLEVTSWVMLSKSILPIPTEHFGIKDEDERYRKRYIDMLLDETVRARAIRRSVFWNAVRSFFLSRGYVEVETPVIETKTGGAEARPFVTHHNALDMPVYLRISPELWHKRLIAAGIPRVFEIGRVFRNEGMSHEHLQDYSHFEFYEAFLDARKGVPMLVDLYREIAEKTYGTLVFTINGHEVDLGKEWEILDYNTLIQDAYGIDPRNVSLDVVKEKLVSANIPIDDSLDVGRGIDLLWKGIRKKIAGPAILVGIPVYLEPLAKKNAQDPRVVDRYQVLIGGSECGKAFNELNDPADQRARFAHQQSLRDAGDEEAQMADWDYVEAMEYGMPPMFGFGVSERLFAFFEGVSVREGQLFPLMRPK